MERNLTNQIARLGANDLATQAMRARRAELLDWIQAAEDTGGEIPEFQLREVLSELFDLNIALGEGFPEDKDGAQ
jgi:hypothetical protein